MLLNESPFVGSQVHFDVDGDDFYQDLLFFHVEQLRYVVIELKTGKFQPEYASKLQFYIALVDDKLRRPAHGPTVGILICGSRNDHTVRYALNHSCHQRGGRHGAARLKSVIKLPFRAAAWNHEFDRSSANAPQEIVVVSQAPAHPQSPRPANRRIHRAWLVAVVTALALIATAAFRSTTGAFFQPLETEFGWDRSGLSTAVMINLVIYGLAAPFAATLIERFSMRKVAIAALLMVSAGAGLAVVITELWHLWLLWGVLVGLGTGAMALVFGAAVANRWFVKHRGLVMGLFSGANAAGQLVFLPGIVQVIEASSWRVASLAVAGFALLIIPLLVWPFANSPAEARTLPYGAGPADQVPAADAGKPRRGAVAATFDVLSTAMRYPAFWVLAMTFWVCGWSTNGLIQTHFIPAAHDHGMPATAASGLLAVIGVFDIIGTMASGWLTDRVRPWLLLAVYYVLRGASLLTLHTLLGPSIQPMMWIFIIFYGLDWVATVPPTVALCRQYFGARKATVVFGWVFAFHMIGAGAGAMTAGLFRDISGSYLIAWIVAALLCFAAALSLLYLPRMRRVEDEEHLQGVPA